MKRKILISAFEPFGGNEVNSSSLVLERIETSHECIEINKLMLPVLYKEAYIILKDAIGRLGPDVVICMGQAGGRSKISIERVAVNINDSQSSDNGGTTRSDKKIIGDGPAAFFTNLPYKLMHDTESETTAISYSAGTYICNDIFYRLMHFIKSENLHIKGGFLHLPYTEHFGKMPYIDLETQVRTVNSLLAVLGDRYEQ